MIKVKNIYYHELSTEERKENPYSNGLIFELENGIKLQMNTTDVVQTFNTLKH